MSQIDIATKYYRAVYLGDHDLVREIASPNIVFEDITAPDDFGIPPNIDDVDTFLSFINEHAIGVTDISFTDKFISNDRVVLTIEMKGKLPASKVGLGDEGLASYTVRGISVLHMVDDKVVRHTDYLDYPGTFNSFKKID